MSENLVQSLKNFKTWVGPTILKDAACTRDTKVFAKAFESCYTNKESSKYHEWKLSRRNNDNDVGTFVMLKYGRNEKLTFCVFIGHERQKLFWGIFIPIIKCFRDFLANIHKKGLFLTSTTLRHYRFLMAEIAILMGFLYSVASF